MKSWASTGYFSNSTTSQATMDGENRPLVTDESVEARDFMKISGHLEESMEHVPQFHKGKPKGVNMYENYRPF